MRGGGKVVLGEETLGGVPQHQICWGGVGSKGEGETKTRGCCGGKLVVRITFGGGWGHPLKWQRETRKGERHQRAKKEARRKKIFSDQWEGRKKFFGEKSVGKRDDWLGGN